MPANVRRPDQRVKTRAAGLVTLQNLSPPGDTFEAMDGLTPNAVIAWNVRRLRRQRGWTQTDLAARLTERDDKPWTFSMVSDAETAGRTDRDRQFTINEVNALARVFQVSVIALFVPDPAQLVRIGDGLYTRSDYVDLVLQFPPDSMPEGFEWRLQNQYAVRNREDASPPRPQPPTPPADPFDVVPRQLLREFLRSERTATPFNTESAGATMARRPGFRV